MGTRCKSRERASDGSVQVSSVSMISDSCASNQAATSTDNSGSGAAGAAAGAATGAATGAAAAGSEAADKTADAAKSTADSAASTAGNSADATRTPPAKLPALPRKLPLIPRMRRRETQLQPRPLLSSSLQPRNSSSRAPGAAAADKNATAPTALLRLTRTQTRARNCPRPLLRCRCSGCWASVPSLPASLAAKRSN